jgi:serine/threonine-protein kinase
MTIKPGMRLGPYEILSSLAVVGLGEIYRGRDHEQGRNVAIRVLRFATNADPTLIPRVAADVLEAGVLTHPSIPKLYDVGTTTDTVYVVSEAFDGETLRALVPRRRPRRRPRR